ncbi:MAG: YifB family Mg chelatase-like AAA ATPase [Oligoflexia bacterium]|nr:YifB family Mg chelatase-like AAA ATPase [Oligoflexia bacterium]
MLGRVNSTTLNGIDAIPVEVEVRGSSGMRNFTIIGLADNAVQEARDRVSSALQQCGFFLPERILVNLAPAEIRKAGAGFDLAIALGILAATGQLLSERLMQHSVLGELSLNGGVKSVRGILPSTICALECGMRGVVVPAANGAEARLISGVQHIEVSSLGEAVTYLNRGELPQDTPPSKPREVRAVSTRSMSDVIGQESAKRALVIAAAGGHNLLMIGPPGCGKSMMAERFSSILPELRREEMLEVVKIHSVAGMPVEGLLTGVRPFRSPHYVVSDAGLIGGGTGPRPGEISLAHHGVLFLDEFPEYRRSALEGLRAPLESGAVNISRARGAFTFPARFQLIAAMNPCPCGRLGMKDNSCRCSPVAVKQYLGKLSGPILDRIDLHVELEPVPISEVSSDRGPSVDSEHSDRLRERVVAARDRQITRQGCLNAALDSSHIRRIIKLDARSLALVESAAKRLNLSARGFFRMMRCALTIADLENNPQVESRHVAEALSFRSLERVNRYLNAA